MRFQLMFLLFPFTLFTQVHNANNLGVSAGVVFDFGTHENELGIELNSFLLSKRTQLNAGTRFSFLLNSFGKRKKIFEQRINLGVLVLGGKRQNTPDQYCAGLNHNSNFNNAFGYNYIWYFDNAGTSQRSGAFGLTFRESSLFFENDVFGGQAKDRFRTGHLLYSFRKNDFRLNFGLNLWTGETSGTSWIKSNDKKCPNGYKNLAKLPYGKTSHGIFYVGFQSKFPYSQFIRFRVGFDSEEIRHFFQNRITHDLIFLPNTVPHNTPHYPRLDENGNPTFNKDSRRKDLYYIQLGANGNWSE